MKGQTVIQFDTVLDSDIFWQARCSFEYKQQKCLINLFNMYVRECACVCVCVCMCDREKNQQMETVNQRKII